MRTHVLAASLLVALTVAAGYARARTAAVGSAAPSTATVPPAHHVAGDCPVAAGSMRPAGADSQADLNRDGYVCVRESAAKGVDTSAVTVDNDAKSPATAPVETNLYRRM